MSGVWVTDSLDNIDSLYQGPGALRTRPFVASCRNLPLFSPSPAPLPPLFSFIISPMAAVKTCLILINGRDGTCGEAPTISFLQFNLTQLGVHSLKWRMHAFYFRQNQPLFDTKRMTALYESIENTKFF